jgi:hypothetical protein
VPGAHRVAGDSQNSAYGFPALSSRSAWRNGRWRGSWRRSTRSLSSNNNDDVRSLCDKMANDRALPEEPKKYSTISAVDGQLRKVLVPALGNVPLTLLSAEMVQNFISSAEGSPKTIRNHVRFCEACGIPRKHGDWLHTIHSNG